MNEALGHNFPFALLLQCFIHFKCNLYSKLHDLGIPKKVADEFVNDAMGSHQGSTYQEGRIDCVTVSDLDQKLSGLESVWNVRETSFCEVSAPRFFNCFKKHKADAVKYNVFKSVRELAGFGSPSFIFTTKESLNKIIKQHVHHNPSQWPDFNDSIKGLVAAKWENVIHACLVED